MLETHPSKNIKLYFYKTKLSTLWPLSFVLVSSVAHQSCMVGVRGGRSATRASFCRAGRGRLSMVAGAPSVPCRCTLLPVYHLHPERTKWQLLWPSSLRSVWDWAPGCCALVLLAQDTHCAPLFRHALLRSSQAVFSEGKGFSWSVNYCLCPRLLKSRRNTV